MNSSGRRAAAFSRTDEVLNSLLEFLTDCRKLVGRKLVKHTLALSFTQGLKHREAVWQHLHAHGSLDLVEDHCGVSVQPKLAPHLLNRGNKRVTRVPRNGGTL